VFAIANAKGAKPGQVALAWLLRKGDDIVPIPGTKRRAFLEENVAADGISLAEEDMQMLDEALATGTVVGNRYPAWIMAGIDR
jgi:aryl-alcohol dehydrogenase-like predicted oxidoreductase